MSQPASSDIRIELRFEKFSAFVEGYAAQLSLGGMFLETDDQRPVGSIVDFEIKLADGFRLIQGLGEVIWARRKAGPARPKGLGVRFQALDDDGRDLILKILEERVRSGLEPFDVEEIPVDVVAEETDTAGEDEASSPANESPEQASESIDTDSRVIPDLEKKILGEDGFTLLDTEQPPRDGEAFDAPWGEALPELPEEVLEEEPAGGESVAPSAELSAESPVAESPVADRSVAESPVAEQEAASAELDAVIAKAATLQAASPSDEESRQAALDDTLALAAEAADEIDASPPPVDALGEPDFDDIDFGVASDGVDDPPLESEGDAGVDFAFDPDPEDQLPSLESMAALDSGGGDSLGESVLAGGSFEAAEDDPTVLSCRSPATVDEVEVPSGALDRADEASFAELSEGPEAAETFGVTTDDHFMPAFGGEVAPDAETPAVDLPPPETAPGTVSVGGAPFPIQDYEDDLFADPSGTEPDSTTRQALPGRWLIAAVLLLALGAAGYFFRGQIAEPVGISEPPAVAPRPTGPPVASKSTPADAGMPSGEASSGEASSGEASSGEAPPGEAPPGESGEASSGEASSDDVVSGDAPVGDNNARETGAEPSSPALEVVEAAETLPPDSDTEDDPAASPGIAAPAAGTAVLEPLALSSSRASRVEKITWRQESDGTRVTVSLDGRLEDRGYLHLPLGYEPAREMVKLIGIDEPYVNSNLEVGSPQVERIRIGHHPRPGGAELHMVFDFPGAGPRLASVRNLGNQLEILIAGR